MLEGEVSGQDLKVCQSDLPSGLSEGEPIIRVGHETCLLPSDINILEVVVSVRVGHEACNLATRPTGLTGPHGSPGQQGHRDHQGQQGYQSHWRQAADELHRPPPTTTSFHSSAHLLGEIELNYLIHFEYPF